jgi:ABC-type oligopeptide transport system substrate-binding subunit
MQNKMKRRHILYAALAAMLLAACGSKTKTEQKSASELIADADHFQVDTIVADPADTLVSTSVDHVLRHYPELYRAAEKAQKIYSKCVICCNTSKKTN